MANQGDQKNQSSGDTSNRGFASMDEDKQKEIASKGGKASHSGDGSQSGNKSGGSQSSGQSQSSSKSSN